MHDWNNADAGNVNRQGYLDLLRGVAIGLVFLFHLEAGFPNGFIGVDIFFALSGYLIFRSIRGTPDIGPGEFLLRRARKILPVGFAFVSAMLLYGMLFEIPSDFLRLSKSLITHLLGVSNFFFLRNTGYFSPEARSQLALHTWSLSVEIQFYLLCAAMLLRKRITTWRFLPFAIVSILFASFVCFVFLHQSEPMFAFYLLPCRLWEFLSGAAIAYLPSAWRCGSKQTLAQVRWISLFGIAATGFSGTFIIKQNSVIGLIAVCLTSIFLIGCELDEARSRLPRWTQPVVNLGQMSYSVYMWHWPVIVIIQTHGQSLSLSAQRVLIILITWMISLISWKMVETSWQRIPTARAGYLLSRFGFVGCILLLAAGAVLRFDGLTNRFPTRSLGFDPVIIETLRTKDRVDLFSSFFNYPKKADTVFFEYNTTQGQLRRGDIPKIGVQHSHPKSRFLIWGDSHGRMLSEVANRTAVECNATGFLAAFPGKPPVVNSKQETLSGTSKAIFDLILREKIDQVWLIARWELYFTKSGAEQAERDLQRTCDLLNEQGVSVVLFAQIPVQQQQKLKREFWIHVNEITKQDRISQVDDSEKLGFGVSKQEYEDRHGNINQRLQSISGRDVRFLDCNFCFSRNNRSILSDQEGSYYWDDDHLSPHGALKLYRMPLKDILSNDGKH